MFSIVSHMIWLTSALALLDPNGQLPKVEPGVTVSVTLVALSVPWNPPMSSPALSLRLVCEVLVEA